MRKFILVTAALAAFVACGATAHARHHGRARAFGAQGCQSQAFFVPSQAVFVAPSNVVFLNQQAFVVKRTPLNPFRGEVLVPVR
jgi:hypothetical protein